MTELVSTLEDMAAHYDVSPLLRHLVPYLVQQIFVSQSGQYQNQQRFSEDRDKVQLSVLVTGDETETDKLHVLESLLKTVPLTKGLDQTVAR